MRVAVVLKAVLGVLGISKSKRNSKVNTFMAVYITISKNFRGKRGL